MTEPHLPAGLDQPGFGGRCGGLGGDAESGRPPATPAAGPRPARPRRSAAAAASPAGRAPSRDRKPSSARSGQAEASGSPNPPASPSGVSPLRQFQQRPRVAPRLGHDPVADLLVERACDDRRPAAPAHRARPARCTTSSGRPVRSAGRRAGAPRRPSRSARPARWRATNASACAEARSSHCASSTTQTSGRSPATSDSRLRTARPTAKRSGASPSRRLNAVRSASRCGPGRRSSRSRNGAHS